MAFLITKYIDLYKRRMSFVFDIGYLLNMVYFIHKMET